MTNWGEKNKCHEIVTSEHWFTGASTDRLKIWGLGVR